MSNPVVHFEIVGKDLKKLSEYYGGLFGWKIDANNPMNYGMVEAGREGGIGGGISAGEESWVTFYVAVDDPQKYLDEAVRMGGRVVQPVMEIPGVVTMAVFADPEEHIIGLVKDEPPPAE